MKLRKLFDYKATQVTAATGLLLALHWFSTDLQPGWVSWGLTLPALAILALTAVARVHDITATGKRWFTRRMGLILVAAACAALAAAPMLGYSNGFPSWRQVALYWGMALTWITTPNMPPWWRYISGEWKLKRGQQG